MPDSDSPYTPPEHSTVLDGLGRNTASLLNATRTSQLIRFALATGVIIITVILMFLRESNEDPEAATLFFLIGTLIALGTTAASVVVPRFAIPRPTLPPRAPELSVALASVDPKEPLPNEVAPLIQQFITLKLVTAALWEGSAVVNLILWFIGGSSLHLIWVALCIVLMAGTFPTLNGLRKHLTESLHSGQ